MVNETMRISSGAFKTMLIVSLIIMVNEPPMQYRRKELLLKYFFIY